MRKYTQKEINQILLNKKLNQFYFAMLKQRQEILTDEELSRFLNSGITYTGGNKLEEKIADKIMRSDKFSKFIKNIMGDCFRWAAVLTMLDDTTIYDVANRKIVDIKRVKIIHYDNLTNYYNETNARVKLYSPKDYPQLKEEIVSIDVDDEKVLDDYGIEHSEQKEDEDLIFKFIAEVKNSSC